MTTKKTLSRRDVTRQLGMAAGMSLLGPGIAVAARPTPAQVEGPFHPIEKQPDTDVDLTRIEGRSNAAEGENILVRGRVLDTQGRPIDGALVDVWQANHHGRYSHPKDPNTAPLDPDFQGWGLMTTAHEGEYGFRTIKPGAYPLSFLGGDGWRCRHIHFKVTRPGYEELVTQMYFHGDPLIAQDQEIAKVPEELHQLLIARPVTDADTGLAKYRFDLVLAAVEA